MYHLQAFKSSKLNLAHKMSMTDHHISSITSTRTFRNQKEEGEAFRQSSVTSTRPCMHLLHPEQFFQKRKGEAGRKPCLAAMLASYIFLCPLVF
jgi:hypothetical protein